jgi:hypothetical protein
MPETTQDHEQDIVSLAAGEWWWCAVHWPLKYLCVSVRQHGARHAQVVDPAVCSVTCNSRSSVGVMV